MTESLAATVARVWNTHLRDYGFVFDKSEDKIDEDGRIGEATWYHNDKCRLQVYWSPRNGELACVIAPLSASIDEYAVRDNSGVWRRPQYISGLEFVNLNNLPAPTNLDERLELRWMSMEPHLTKAMEAIQG